MKVRSIFLFWGVMDIFYIARFCYVNYSQGRIPLYDDIQSFMLLAPEHGYVATLFFSLSLVLNVSIIISMVLFFRGSRNVPGLVYAQIPLRLLLAMPSLAFIPWMAKVGDFSSVGLLLSLLVLSEVIKFSSIFFRDALK